MSSIFFGGNTYTFGATVSANPGTGITSYVFGGLSSGSTYGFIIWAFNGIGPSTIVGPSIINTLSINPETRDQITVFGWFGGPSLFDQPESGVTGNMIINSENMTERFWFNSGITLYSKGVTLIDGVTSNYVVIKNLVDGAYVTPTAEPLLLQQGITYIFSIYINLDYSKPDGIRFYPQTKGTLANSAYNEQLLPSSVAGRTGYNILWRYPVGGTGWQRFASTVIPSITDYHYIVYMATHGNTASRFHFANPQLEVAS